MSAIRAMSKTHTAPGLDVVYVSEGYIEGEMRALIAAAVDANAAIHSINARDLVGGAPERYGITQDEWDRYLAVTRQSLRNLSVSTGGVIVVNDDDLVQALDRLGARQP